LPDLYASDRGGIILLSDLRVFSVSGSPCVKYKGTNISARSLVADAWIPKWDQQGPQLESLDGDRMNLHAANLRPTSGMRGRPPGGRLRFLAMVFQTFVRLRSVTGTAEALGIPEGDVRSAVALFDADMLHLSL
jgi:hypothetical protein